MAARRTRTGCRTCITAMNKSFFLVALLAILGLSCCVSQSRQDQRTDQLETETSKNQGETPNASGVQTSGTKTSFVKPDKPHTYVPSFPGRRISRVSVPGKYVALTFDDGPHATHTPYILDVLARHNARATFFVLGQRAAQHPEILRRAVSQGCEIGSHTWTHINMARSSQATIKSELDRTAAVISQATGRAPRVVRPPYGAGGTSVINYIYDLYGAPSILWDVDTNDWRKPGVQTVINRAVNSARPGSIILVHDIHGSTASAVEGIVTGLQQRGYTLVTVSELIDMGRRAALEAGKTPAATSTPAAPAAPSTPAVAPAPAAPPVLPAAPDTPSAPAVPAAPAANTASSSPTAAVIAGTSAAL